MGLSLIYIHRSCTCLRLVSLPEGGVNEPRVTIQYSLPYSSLSVMLRDACRRARTRRIRVVVVCGGANCCNAERTVFSKCALLMPLEALWLVRPGGVRQRDVRFLPTSA